MFTYKNSIILYKIIFIYKKTGKKMAVIMGEND